MMSLSSTLAELLHQLNPSIFVHTSTESISVLLSPYRESGAASGTATWAAWKACNIPSGSGCQHLDHRITNEGGVPRITALSFCTVEDGGLTKWEHYVHPGVRIMYASWRTCYVILVCFFQHCEAKCTFLHISNSSFYLQYEDICGSNTLNRLCSVLHFVKRGNYNRGGGRRWVEGRAQLAPRAVELEFNQKLSVDTLQT